MIIWIAPDPQVKQPTTMTVAVDDAVISGLPLNNAIPTNVRLIWWYGDRGQGGSGQQPLGEILYNDRAPMREPFTDPTPYITQIKQWMTAASQATNQPLSVAQAQKIQNNLIDGLFAGKSTAPVSVGGQTYNASEQDANAMARQISAAA